MSDLPNYVQDLAAETSKTLAKRLVQDGFIQNQDVIPITMTIAMSLMMTVTQDSPVRKEAIKGAIRHLLTEI